jgi:hypothetical protein
MLVLLKGKGLVRKYISFVERWKFSQKYILIFPKDRDLVLKRYWFCQEILLCVNNTKEVMV